MAPIFPRGQLPPLSARVEAGDPSVSIDLLVHSLFSLGAMKRDLARIITASRKSKAA